MQIINVKPTDIAELASLANTVWHEFFPIILTTDQIDYMVDKYQSIKAITAQLADGYNYYFLDDGKRLGYFGIKVDVDGLFLSKLYLLKSSRGHGYTKDVMHFLETYAKEYTIERIWLTVNKYNEHSINVYEHYGFVKIAAVVTDIGSGYVMDDYIMEKKLTKEA